MPIFIQLQCFSFWGTWSPTPPSLPGIFPWNQERRLSVSIGGRTRGCGDGNPPAESRGRDPGGGLGTKFPKAEHYFNKKGR